MGCAIVGSVCSYQELKEHIAYGRQRFRERVDQRPRKYLLRGGIVVLGCKSVFWVLSLFWPVAGSSYLAFGYNLSDALGAVLKLVLDLWILCAVFNAVGPPGGVYRLSFRWLLLGWAFSSVFIGLYIGALDFPTVFLAPAAPFGDLLYLAGTLTGGTSLWGEEPGTYGVAFWGAVTLLCNNIISCVTTWLLILYEGLVT